MSAEAALLGLILQKVNKLNPKFIHCCLLRANNSDFEVRWDHAVLRTLGKGKGSSTAPADQGSFQSREQLPFAEAPALSSRMDPVGLSGVRGVWMDQMQMECSKCVCIGPQQIYQPVTPPSPPREKPEFC